MARWSGSGQGREKLAPKTGPGKWHPGSGLEELALKAKPGKWYTGPGIAMAVAHSLQRAQSAVSSSQAQSTKCTVSAQSTVSQSQQDLLCHVWLRKQEQLQHVHVLYAVVHRHHCILLDMGTSCQHRRQSHACFRLHLP
eukprot:1065054-Pelagomonas_calceolata.AAC.1